MIFGAKSSPTSANYCLKRTAIDNQNTSSEETTSTVLRDFYMDDLLKSLPFEAIFLAKSTADKTIKAIFAISAAPSVAKAAMIMAVTLAEVSSQSYHFISLHKLLMMVHRIPAA